LAELLTDLSSLQTSQADRRKQTEAERRMQAFFINLIPRSFRFFFNSGLKKEFSLSLDVKGDQQTHKK
jgi:hypothetical protein